MERNFTETQEAQIKGSKEWPKAETSKVMVNCRKRSRLGAGGNMFMFRANVTDT